MGDLITYAITFLIVAPLISMLWIGAVWIVVHGYEQIMDAIRRLTQ